MIYFNIHIKKLVLNLINFYQKVSPQHLRLYIIEVLHLMLGFLELGYIKKQFVSKKKDCLEGMGDTTRMKRKGRRKEKWYGTPGTLYFLYSSLVVGANEFLFCGFKAFC